MNRILAEIITTAALEVCAREIWPDSIDKRTVKYWETQVRKLQTEIADTKNTVDFWAGEIKKIDGTRSTTYRSLKDSIKYLDKASEGLNQMRNVRHLGSLDRGQRNNILPFRRAA